MGRLHRLELENFKSYLGVQIIGPFENFSCIVGPNGAGKSNMMDAISFVLGVQSKHLRSTHLKELIFRQDADSAPARRASVKLVYIVSEDEIDCKEAGTEVHFSRTISASGVSNYKLDAKDVTYEVYENVLQNIGVLVKARNFLVFQGDVESVASKSPAQLTKLLEQISGSDQLQKEYDDLLRKKDEAEEATIFSMQKKKMYVTQRKEVKEQKDEADLFQLRQDELDDLKTEHVLWQIWRVKMDIEDHQTASDTFKKELLIAKDKELKLDEEMLEGKKELARVSKVLITNEKEQIAKSKLLDSLTPKLAETRAKLVSLRKRITDLSRSEGKIQKDQADQQRNIEGLRADIGALEQAEEELREELESAGSEGLQLDTKKAEEYARLREEVSARTATERVEELAVETEIKSKGLRVQRIETQIEAARVEVEATTKQSTDYSDRGTKLKGSITEGEAEREALRKGRDEAVEGIKESQKVADTLNAEYEEVCMHLRDVGDDRRRTKQEERVAEAIENMQRIFTGVHGKLGDLCRPIQKKYAQAVSVTAGKLMDAIVVDTKHVASECIRYLKDQRIGTCIFLPLDNITVKPVPERLRALGGRYRLCMDLVESEDAFRPALSYALGSALVCDTLEEAQELCFTKGEKVKVVTLKGHVISKTGSMTGGVNGRDGGDRWEEKEVGRLRKRKGELEEFLAKNKQTAPTRQQIVDIETRLKTLQTRLQYTEADLKVTVEKTKQLDQQKGLKEESMRALGKEITGLRKDVKVLDARLKQLLQHTREVEVEIFGSFSNSVGVENIREYEDDVLKAHQILVAKRTAVSEQKASLSAQLEYEMKRDFKGALNRFQTQLAEARSADVALDAEVGELLKKEEKLIATVREAKGKTLKAQEEKTSAALTVKELQTARTAVSTDRTGLEKKVSGEEISIERRRAQLHEVLQRAQVDEVALPAINTEDEEGAGGGAVGVAGGRGGKNKGRSSSSDEKDNNDKEEDDLAWTGSQTEHGSSLSSGLKRKNNRATKRTGNDSENSESVDSRTTSLGTGKLSNSTHFSQQENTVVAKDRRAAAKVDLSSMAKHRNMSAKQMGEAEAFLLKSILALVSELENIQPNMHAAERYEGVVDKLRECEKDLEASRDVAGAIGGRFEQVKRERQDLFQECYQHVSESLGVIYRDLTRSSKHPLGGNAYLTLDNTDEPYLGGIRFTAMPPMKRFRDMEQLSGGEKTMAALGLLFSIHSFRQAPFFVLDEVDAALDNVNVKKICNYIRQRSKDFQCVVISLKDMFFEHADILVGICKDVDSLSSKVLTLNLKTFDDSSDQSGSSVNSKETKKPFTLKNGPILSSPLSRGTHTPSTKSSSKASNSSVGSKGSVRSKNSPFDAKGGLEGLSGGKRKAGGDSTGTGRRPRVRSALPLSIEEGDEEEEGEDKTDRSNEDSP